MGGKGGDSQVFGYLGGASGEWIGEYLSRLGNAGFKIVCQHDIGANQWLAMDAVAILRGLLKN